MYEELIKRLKSESTLPYGAIKDMREAADAIEDLQKQLSEEKVDNVNLTGWLAEEHAKHLWIPVTERLPEMNTSCLLYNKYYGPMVGARIDEMRFRIPGSRFPDTPTHWMPLPQPPKEETEDV